MRLVFVAALSALVSVPAFAAETMPAQPGPQNPAIHANERNNSNMPVAGANSYTHDEAVGRIRARGFTHISRLQKDANGVWRGTARRHGRTVRVSVDFQGNVN